MTAFSGRKQLRTVGGEGSSSSSSLSINSSDNVLMNLRLVESAKKALGGGLAGACAMVVQVLLLMWLRTTMNYQYARSGVSTFAAIRILYANGGIGRFYRGLIPALIEAPLAKFGDIAANSGVLSYFSDGRLSLRSKTFLASIIASIWRALIMPVDTLKTTLQVKGAKGMEFLAEQVLSVGPSSLYNGALGAAFSCLVGHFPWFLMFNYLSDVFKDENRHRPGWRRHAKRAAVGFAASVFSDTISNGFRVLKTIKQTSSGTLSYWDAFETAVSTEGAIGFWTRGLGTRLICNGLGAMLFTVVWKSLEEAYFLRGAGRVKRPA